MVYEEEGEQGQQCAVLNKMVKNNNNNKISKMVREGFNKVTSK